MKFRPRNNTPPDAVPAPAPVEVAVKRGRYFAIDEAVPAELRPDVLCSADAGQQPEVEEYSDDLSLLICRS
ncbi:TPA: hypothetical protein ACH3X2_012953 [Trebouxia sp. C0005]